MSIEAGHKLAHYEILEPIGKGAMGEVYRAKDLKLGRDVAIKVLPEKFRKDTERLARFQREAKVLASLNHPGIASIHGLEEFEGTHFLILEYVPGETLAERISRGPIPVDVALDIAAQVAVALEAAHEHGVVHRDLKPANIKITPDGIVKLLDFGLAKALAGDTTTSDLSESPTITAAGTRAGVILGTPAYMSPEQARAGQVDKRTDIWAFGCVLYEMLVGQEAFPGQTVSDVLAAVLTREPNWEALPTITPFLIGRLLRHCLQKERRKRIPDIGVATIEINDALTAPTAARTPGVVVASRLGSLPWVVAGVTTALAVVLAILWPSEVDVPPRPIRRFEIQPNGTPRYYQADVSPDGTRLVYPSLTPEGRVLLVRRFDELVARPLSGTEGGRGAFFSPDGEWIGFRTTAGQLMKVPVNGGVPVTLCVLPRGTAWRMSWSAGGDIIFGSVSGAVWRVSEAGGEPEVLFTPDKGNGELDWHSPRFLPGGDTALFTLHDQNREFRIEVLSLVTGERKVLIEGAFDGRYVPDGTHRVRPGEQRAGGAIRPRPARDHRTVGTDAGQRPQCTDIRSRGLQRRSGRNARIRSCAVTGWTRVGVGEP